MVPHKFVNSTPPVNDTDLDANAFNENFDSLSDGTAFNDKIIKQNHIDESSMLVTYFIKKFVTPENLSQDPSEVALVKDDIVAVNGSGEDVGKLFKISDILLPIFVPYTNESITKWKSGVTTTSETSLRVTAHKFIITGVVGKPLNSYEGSAYYPVTNLNLDIYDELKITILSSTSDFYVRLLNGNIPGGELELINSAIPGTYLFNIKNLSGLSGIQSFTLEVGISDPSLVSILNDTISISQIIFTSQVNRWTLYKPQILNFEVVNKTNNKKYRLKNDTGWEWLDVNSFLTRVITDETLTGSGTEDDPLHSVSAGNKVDKVIADENDVWGSDGVGGLKSLGPMPSPVDISGKVDKVISDENDIWGSDGVGGLKSLGPMPSGILERNIIFTNYSQESPNPKIGGSHQQQQVLDNDWEDTSILAAPIVGLSNVFDGETVLSGGLFFSGGCTIVDAGFSIRLKLELYNSTGTEFVETLYSTAKVFPDRDYQLPYVPFEGFSIVVPVSLQRMLDRCQFNLIVQSKAAAGTYIVIFLDSFNQKVLYKI